MHIKKRRSYYRAMNNIGRGIIHVDSRIFKLVPENLKASLTGLELALVVHLISDVYDMAYKEGQKDDDI